MTDITIVPKLVAAGADRAIDFYQKALNAELIARYTAPDGSVVYSELTVGSSRISVKDEDGTDRAAPTVGGSPVILTLEVDDADAVANRMLDAGASTIFPVDDRGYGYRQGRVEDPFGYQWIISQRTEDLDTSEVQQRLDSAAP
ncbi:VOC family protein [Phytoactinopolyspora halotolerans]|uniref:VOC family protein n=1 Tax=Phytoactinopolyspora halotolerans TaxID=1981512 RepID=A0A6L9S6X2_9ACTN|nr:VOC family protein [Phytoactinopolyspora halotolerans]NEE00723.1 VOC family protein [Phytoactinopolyspora halotolerans]